MEGISLTEDELAQWLHAAKAAHAKFEAENGPDADWPEWYAHYIFTEASAAHTYIDASTPVYPASAE